MVERLHHLAFIQRQVKLLAALPAVAFDGIETFGIELRGGAEEVGVVGHVKHGAWYLTGQVLCSVPSERSTSTGWRA